LNLRLTISKNKPKPLKRKTSFSIELVEELEEQPVRFAGENE